ncbi:unnamed protein product [Vicia faba]|uniref:FAR1 domain-containing protein n=1 Tax=Vicia faba TaxID=3906 RepID=A0AAV0YKC5_VICFA|nr:unnamed protein product [Vicia faba]
MENSDDSFEVDSNEVHSTDCDTSDVQLNDDEGDIYQSSDDDVDDADNDDEDDSVELDAIVSDKVVSVNSMTSDEICAMEFGYVNDVYDFYYKYGKCKGFSIRKSDIRRKGHEGSKITVMRQFVCNKHGSRENKYLCSLDRKRDHKRLTCTKCTARHRVHYKAKKGIYVVSIFKEAHNHELTPSRFVHLHPVYHQIYEADRAQINVL